MIDPTDTQSPASVWSTDWLEQETRRLLQERNDWRNRWQSLKDWVVAHRPELDWATYTALVAMMEQLETTTPAPVPTFVPEQVEVGTDEDTDPPSQAE